MDEQPKYDFSDYRPDPMVAELLAQADGNEINGLGEDALRAPTPIMWHEPDRIKHAKLQMWFFSNGASAAASEEMQKTNAFTGSMPKTPLGERPDWDAETWSAEIKQAALTMEADQVGIARMRPEWIFEGYEAPYEWMIVIAVEMDYEELSKAPSPLSQAETQRQYGRGTRAAYKLASWLQERGVEAHPHGGPMAGSVLMIPAAIEAGLGELGKHGSMINSAYGSSFRLACVLTNEPLIADGIKEFGADDFCMSCQICVNACPVDALSMEKQMVRGVERWYVDFNKCMPFFAEHCGCGICIVECPWSRPGVAPRLAEKMTRRREGREESGD